MNMRQILTTLLLCLISLAAGADTLVTPPAGAESKSYYASAYSYAKSDNRAFNITIVRDGSDIYIKGLYPELPEAWISGKMGNDNVAKFPSGQYVGTVSPEMVDDSHETFEVYFYCSMDLNNARDLELAYNPDNDTYEATFQYVLFSEKDDIRARYEHMQNLNVFSGAHITTTKPENLKTANYRLQGYECSLGKDLEYGIEVGFAEGNEVYVRGISAEFPDAWVRGTREQTGNDAEIVRFMRNQYLGPYTLGEKTFDIWFTGINHDEAYFTEVIFDYKPSTGVFTQKEGNWLVINGDPVLWKWLNNMSNIELYPNNDEEEVDYYAMVTPPAGTNVVPFTATGSDCTYELEHGEELNPYTVNIGFCGNDCYVQGILTEMPEAWVRGKISEQEDGNVVLTLGSPQYMGKWYGSMDCWFMAVDDSGVYLQTEICFSYDKATGSFVQAPDTYIFLNDVFDSPSNMYLQAVKGLRLKGEIPEAIQQISADDRNMVDIDRTVRKVYNGKHIIIRRNTENFYLDGRRVHAL